MFVVDSARMCGLLSGFVDVDVMAVEDVSGKPLVVYIKSNRPRESCHGCGGKLWIKKKYSVELKDLPAKSPRGERIMFCKRLLECPDKSCEVKSFAEQRPDIVPANSSLSTRAGKWTVGQAVEGHSVSSMSRTLKCDWDTVNKALNYWGQRLLDACNDSTDDNDNAEGDDNSRAESDDNSRADSDDNSRADSDDNSRAEGDDNGSTEDSGNDRVESDDNSRAESDDNDSTDDNDNADSDGNSRAEGNSNSRAESDENDSTEDDGNIRAEGDSNIRAESDSNSRAESDENDSTEDDGNSRAESDDNNDSTESDNNDNTTDDDHDNTENDDHDNTADDSNSRAESGDNDSTENNNNDSTKNDNNASTADDDNDSTAGGVFGSVMALGLDENFMCRRRVEDFIEMWWITVFVDVKRIKLLDVVFGRSADASAEWLLQQLPSWRQEVKYAVMDMSGPYGRAYRQTLPDAKVVVDPFHVVKAANTALNQVRCTEQKLALSQDIKRKDHPLYKVRKLLTMGKEKLTDEATAKLETALAAGDPHGRVRQAYNAKELVRSIYTTIPKDTNTTDDHVARVKQIAKELQKPEFPAPINKLGRMILKWVIPIANWCIAQVSNGPTEAINNLIKHLKRTGCGFTNFDNYRIRILLYVGKPNLTLLNTLT